MLAILVCIFFLIIVVLLLSILLFFNFFLDMNSSTLDSQDSVRRKWAPEEDIKLVQALVEHYNEGNDRYETMLQPDYLRILENKALEDITKC
jgi:hypothetical protein